MGAPLWCAVTWAGAGGTGWGRKVFLGLQLHPAAAAVFLPLQVPSLFLSPHSPTKKSMECFLKLESFTELWLYTGNCVLHAWVDGPPGGLAPWEGLGEGLLPLARLGLETGAGLGSDHTWEFSQGVNSLAHWPSSPSPQVASSSRSCVTLGARAPDRA